MAKSKIDWSQYEVKEPQKSGSAIDWSQYEVDESSIPEEATDQESSIFQDIKNAALNAPEDIAELIKNLPEALEAHGKSLEEHPFTGILRTLGKMGEGVVEGGKAAVNLPGIVGKYLSKKDVPIFSSKFPFADSENTLGELASKIKIGDSGLAKKIFGEPTDADAIPEMVGSGIPFGMGAKGASLLEKAGRGAAFGASQEQNPLATALLGIAPELVGKSGSAIAKKPIKSFKDAKNLRRIEGETRSAEEDFASKKDELESFRDALYEKYRTSDPRKLQADAEQGKKRLEELEPIANREKVDLSNRLPGATGEGIVKEAQLNRSEKLNDIQKFLDPLEEHDVNAAEEWRPMINETKSDIGSMFDAVENDLEGKTITPRSERTAQNIMEDLTGLIKKGQHESSEALELLNELDNLGKEESIPAKRFMSAWRSVDKLAKDTKSNAFEIGISQDTRDALMERASELAEKAKKMESVIEDSLGTDSLDLLKKAKSRWATEITPLYDSPMFHQIMKYGRINSSNIMKDLRGSGKAENILNNMAEKNPAILKNLIAQRFAQKPENLVNANKHQQKYINKVPELQGMLSNFKQSDKAFSEALSKQQAFKEEANRVEAAYKEDVKYQEERQKALKEYTKLAQDIEDKTKDAELARKVISNAGSSKEEVAKKNRELKDSLDAIQKSKSKLVKIVSTLLKIAGVKYGLNLF